MDFLGGSEGEADGACVVPWVGILEELVFT